MLACYILKSGSCSTAAVSCYCSCGAWEFRGWKFTLFTPSSKQASSSVINYLGWKVPLTLIQSCQHRQRNRGWGCSVWTSCCNAVGGGDHCPTKAWRTHAAQRAALLQDWKKQRSSLLWKPVEGTGASFKKIRFLVLSPRRKLQRVH